MKNPLCKNLSFSDCELAILRSAVDKAEKKQGSKIINSNEIKQMIEIVEQFIRDKKLICYGGTAINNILPKKDQFYNKDEEIPDYDFFSYNALDDTKQLCDIFYKNGFVEVEGKAGQHHGTYKVFVNFIPIADITYLHKELFNVLKKNSIKVAGILYPSANYLRMGMYSELSRPDGDISRWEKVLKRLSLLNKNYPLISNDCSSETFQREMENISNSAEIFTNVKQTLIDQGVVFFGGYALSLYSKYMPHQHKKQLSKIPDFDVIAENPPLLAQIIQEKLENIGIKHIKIIKHPPVGEIISESHEITIHHNGIIDSIVFIYKPIACHSYNTIKDDGNVLKIATIDTMLSFYLAFLYANRKYYNNNRIMCMAAFLFKVQQENRLEQKGVLKRFSINCIGHQETIEEMRAHKSEKYQELKNKHTTREYDIWFLRYRPFDNDSTNDTHLLKKEKRILRNKSKKINNNTRKNNNPRKKRKHTKKILDYFKL
jgi:hypothetical protein